MKYHVEKCISIEAPLHTVKPFIEDFHRWDSWSPWKIVEPDCPTEISGQVATVGHSMSWDGKVIGSGKNTIAAIEEEKIEFNLEFFKPFKSTAKTAFILEDQGESTKVTWMMDSSLPFFMFFMVKMMKNWIGMDYDRGLRMLKEMAEKGEVKAKTQTAGIKDLEEISYVGIQRSLPFSEMPNAMKSDFEKIVQDVVVKRGKGARHWVCLYPKFNMKTMDVTYVAAISDEDVKQGDLGGDYITGKIKPGKAFEVTHDGSYEFLGNAWSMGMMHTRAGKMKSRDVPFEQYWNSPLEVSPEELKTSVFFPVKD